MTVRNFNRGLLSVLAPLVVGVAVLAIWQSVCHFMHIPPYLLPAPSDILRSLIVNWPILLDALGSTLKVTVLAFVISAVLGILLAFCCAQSRLVALCVFPYIIILQVTPIVAVAPLIIILVKAPSVALVVCAVVIAIFPVVSNTLQGLQNIDPDLESYFRMHKATRLQTLLRLRIPSAIPLIMAGLRISSGLSLVGAVVAEFVAGTGGSGSGLAYEILQSGFQMDIPRMFAALVLITLTGLLLYLIMITLQHMILRRWAPKSDR